MKYFKGFIFALIAVLVFSTCKKDDDPVEPVGPSQVGTWETTQQIYSYYISGVLDSTSTITTDLPTYEFYEDGTGRTIEADTTFSEILWSYDNDRIVLTNGLGGGQAIVMEVLEFTDQAQKWLYFFQIGSGTQTERVENEFSLVRVN